MDSNIKKKMEFVVIHSLTGPNVLDSASRVARTVGMYHHAFILGF